MVISISSSYFNVAIFGFNFLNFVKELSFKRV